MSHKYSVGLGKRRGTAPQDAPQALPHQMRSAIGSGGIEPWDLGGRCLKQPVTRNILKLIHEGFTQVQQRSKNESKFGLKEPTFHGEMGSTTCNIRGCGF